LFSDSIIFPKLKYEDGKLEHVEILKLGFVMLTWAETLLKLINVISKI